MRTTPKSAANATTAVFAQAPGRSKMACNKAVAGEENLLIES